jgi:serine/threonine protein kinase
MSLQFLAVAGPDKGKAFLIYPGPDRMLGRSATAEYRLTDPRISRNHCQLVLEADQVTLIDNDSQGGTFVNGQRVKRQVLKLGDVIQIGDTQLRLQVADLPLDAVQELAQLAAADADAPPAAPAAEKLTVLSGRTLSHYDIGPVIGEGSSSIVFHATDTKDNRPVAFKVLRPEFSKNDEDVQRFIRGMKTALPLRHPNLVTIYAAGKTDEYCWVAMEYIAGENMSQVIQRIGVAGMLDWRYAFKVAVHVGRALAYAHGQHIIHRNLTPKNILLEAPTKMVKLGDLMLAKALEGSLALQITRPGELVGEVAYMAPERTRANAVVDARSDLYGLGATVYALLTGRPPFEGAGLPELVTKIRQSEPVKPTKYQLSIPSHFEGLVLKLLAKRPEDRYQTAEDLLKELERVGKLKGVTA